MLSPQSLFVPTIAGRLTLEREQFRICVVEEKNVQGGCAPKCQYERTRHKTQHAKPAAKFKIM